MLSKAHAVKADAVSVGFGRASLRGTWATALPFEDDIEANALVLRKGRRPPVAVMNCDMLSMLPATCLRIRDQVARTIGATPEQVGVFCTQNHGVPLDSPAEFDLDRLAARFAEVADQALRAAQPASMAYVETAPRPAGVVKRRKRFDGVGTFTFYYGFDVRPDGQAGCAESAGTRLEGVDGRAGDCAEASLSRVRAMASVARSAAACASGFDPGRAGRSADPGDLFQGNRWPAVGQHQPLGRASDTANVARQAGASITAAIIRFICAGRWSANSAAGRFSSPAPAATRRRSSARSRGAGGTTGEEVARQLLEALRAAIWQPVTTCGG